MWKHGKYLKKKPQKVVIDDHQLHRESKIGRFV